MARRRPTKTIRRAAFGLRRAAAAPIGRCVALGAMLFAAERAWTARLATEAGAKRMPIVVAAADRSGSAAAAPAGGVTAAGEMPAVPAQIDDEVLLGEALARGFDRQDRAVRERLRSLGRFLDVAPERDATALEREARALGFERSDLALRRHLVEMMRLAAAKTGRADLPSEPELRAYYAVRAADLTPPPAIRLTHVYLSRARRGAAAERDAETVLARLRLDPAAPAPALGDPFARGAAIGPASPQRLDAIFGPGFAAAVTGLRLGTWAGPVRSSYGVHLVRIDAIVPGAPPPFAAVRGRLLHELLRARGAERLRETMRALRDSYAVRSAAHRDGAVARPAGQE
jgi:hypothetical protein